MPELKPTEGRLREKLAYSTASESSAARQNDAAVSFADVFVAAIRPVVVSTMPSKL